MAKIVTRTVTLPLATMAYEARSNAPDSPDLDPRDCEDLPIVERVSGRYQIVDGFHRLSGLVGWYAAEGVTDATVQVLDVTGSDEDVIAAAACPEGCGNLTQDAAQAMLRGE